MVDYVNTHRSPSYTHRERFTYPPDEAWDDYAPQYSRRRSSSRRHSQRHFSEETPVIPQRRPSRRRSRVPPPPPPPWTDELPEVDDEYDRDPASWEPGPWSFPLGMPPPLHHPYAPHGLPLELMGLDHDPRLMMDYDGFPPFPRSRSPRPYEIDRDVYPGHEEEETDDEEYVHAVPRRTPFLVPRGPPFPILDDAMIRPKRSRSYAGRKGAKPSSASHPDEPDYYSESPSLMSAHGSVRRSRRTSRSLQRRNSTPSIAHTPLPRPSIDRDHQFAECQANYGSHHKSSASAPGSPLGPSPIESDDFHDARSQVSPNISEKPISRRNSLGSFGRLPRRRRTIHALPSHAPPQTAIPPPLSLPPAPTGMMMMDNPVRRRHSVYEAGTVNHHGLMSPMMPPVPPAPPLFQTGLATVGAPQQPSLPPQQQGLQAPQAPQPNVQPGHNEMESPTSDPTTAMGSNSAPVTPWMSPRMSAPHYFGSQGPSGPVHPMMPSVMSSMPMPLPQPGPMSMPVPLAAGFGGGNPGAGPVGSLFSPVMQPMAPFMIPLPMDFAGQGIMGPGHENLLDEMHLNPVSAGENLIPPPVSSEPGEGIQNNASQATAPVSEANRDAATSSGEAAKPQGAPSGATTNGTSAASGSGQPRAMVHGIPPMMPPMGGPPASLARRKSWFSSLGSLFGVGGSNQSNEMRQIGQHMWGMRSLENSMQNLSIGGQHPFEHMLHGDTESFPTMSLSSPSTSMMTFPGASTTSAKYSKKMREFQQLEFIWCFRSYNPAMASGIEGSDGMENRWIAFTLTNQRKIERAYANGSSEGPRTVFLSSQKHLSGTIHVLPKAGIAYHYPSMFSEPELLQVDRFPSKQYHLIPSFEQEPLPTSGNGSMASRLFGSMFRNGA